MSRNRLLGIICYSIDTYFVWRIDLHQSTAKRTWQLCNVLGIRFTSPPEPVASLIRSTDHTLVNSARAMRGALLWLALSSSIKFDRSASDHRPALCPPATTVKPMASAILIAY
jgi:hypothetical protein